MSLGHGSKIVTDGLAFAYDMGSKRSWKGKPTTNLVNADPTTYTAQNSITVTPLNETYEGNTVYRVVFPSGTLPRIYQTFAYTDGQTYTGSLHYRTVDYIDGQAPALFFRENGFGTTYANQTFSSNTDYVWRTAEITHTFAGAGTCMYLIYLSNSGNTNPITVDIAMPQCELNSFATPFVDGTRSNSEAIVDWATNKTMTIDKLTYNSDNTFSFDGSTGRYINLGTQLVGTGSTVTIETWFKSTNTGSNALAYILGWGEGNANYSSVGIGNWVGAFTDESIHIGLNSASVIAHYRGGESLYHDNQWHHAVFVAGPANYKIYVDGGDALPLEYSHGNASVSTGDIFSFGNVNCTTEIGNRPYGGGNGPWNGQIPIVRVYNRELSPAEIKQNFNALRGRFGL